MIIKAKSPLQRAFPGFPTMTSGCRWKMWMFYSLWLFYSDRNSLSRYFKVTDYFIDIRIAIQIWACILWWFIRSICCLLYVAI